MYTGPSTNMNVSETKASPKFKNLCFKHKQSPKELKDKMRKNYKDKVHNCRQMLMDKFRGPVQEDALCNTLTEIYKTMFESNGDIENDEIEILEELRNELVHEEMEWWLQEYEKSQLDNIDWSKIEEDDSVICPVCQKANFKIENDKISCIICKFKIETQKSLSEIKKSILLLVEKHSAVCSHDPQFNVIPEVDEAHIYFICDICMTVNTVV